MLSQELANEVPQVYKTPISMLGINSTRICSALRRLGIKYVEQLVKVELEDLKRVKKLGIVSIRQINDRLKEIGFIGRDL